MTEHWLVRVSKAWKIISDSVREYYQSDKRRFIEGLVGNCSSLALTIFLLFWIVLPIPVPEAQGLDARKPLLLHVLALVGTVSVLLPYGHSIARLIHVIDEIPIRYIKYLIKTRKNLRDLK